MYRELAKGALKRTVEDLRVRAAELAEQKKRDRESGASRADNPALDAERQRDAQLRELADQAHGVNLDLGSDLLMSLSAVDPLDRMSHQKGRVLLPRRPGRRRGTQSSLRRISGAGLKPFAFPPG